MEVALSSKKLSLSFLLVYLYGLRLTCSYVCNNPEEWNHIAGNKTLAESLWPNGIVKYEIHESVTSTDMIEVQKAFYEIQNKTCIRFVPRSSEDVDYTSIQHDNSVCGMAHLCRIGGNQYAKFGDECIDMNTIVHELGHNLCLIHEQQRWDRDEHLHFKPCKPYQIPPIEEYDTRGHLYDTASQMHYYCGWCLGGWPRQKVIGCGQQVTDGLSVLDADELNDLYDCKDCFSHRWRPITSLSEENKKDLVPFGSAYDNETLYMCRANINGEIATGKLRMNSQECFIPFDGVEHNVHDQAQVFTVPGFGQMKSNEKFPYKLGYKNSANLIAVGTGRDGIVIYAAVGEVSFEGIREVGIGKVYGSNLSVAYMPVSGEEVQVTNFEFLTCP